MAEQEAIGLLQQLARDFNVRDPRKLFQIARREFPDRRDLTSAAALRSEAGAGAQAKEPGEKRGGGAERPVAGGPGGLQPEHAGAQQVWPGGHGCVHEGGGHQGPTGQASGNRDPGGAGPGGGQLRRDHRLGKRISWAGGSPARGRGAPPEGPHGPECNGRGDRAIQTLKKDLAGKVARDGGGWAEHADEVAEAYNARPHQAVTVAPEDVETKPAATFRVYQDNARKFKHNDELTRGRQRRLEEAGAFRAPTNAQRSFQPQYGAVREVADYDSMTVRATDGSETLLKHALPVPRGSAEPKARLTRPPVPLAVRQLRDFNPGPVAPP